MRPIATNKPLFDDSGKYPLAFCAEDGTGTSVVGVDYPTPITSCKGTLKIRGCVFGFYRYDRLTRRAIFRQLPPVLAIHPSSADRCGIEPAAEQGSGVRLVLREKSFFYFD